MAWQPEAVLPSPAKRFAALVSRVAYFSQISNFNHLPSTDQQTCGTTTAENNTYFVNQQYPGSWAGGSSCSITVNPCSDSVCQLRVEILDLALAPPNGDGICNTDIFSVSGGANAVPSICGENSGQHVVVDFVGTNSITVSVSATAAYTFGRHWNIRLTQINCDSANRGNCFVKFHLGIF